MSLLFTPIQLDSKSIVVQAATLIQATERPAPSNPCREPNVAKGRSDPKSEVGNCVAVL